jgi:superfamily I DNA/RNA helicase
MSPLYEGTTMYVYVVLKYEYENETVLAVHATEEAAERVKERVNKALLRNKYAYMAVCLVRRMRLAD